MKYSKVLFLLELVLVFTLSKLAPGQEKATAQEIVSKVQEAANTLAKSGEAKAGEASLKQFDQKQSPWVWKDSTCSSSIAPVT
jgi:hypothetical protein